MTALDPPSPPLVTGHPACILVIGHASSAALAPQLPDVAVLCALPDADADAVLATLTTAVVVVVVPPADVAMVLRVALFRRGRPGIRAMLVDPRIEPELRLAALEAGFDEAMPIELGDAEIAGRVAIQVARARATQPTRLTVGTGVELDVEARALRRRGRFIHLRPLEFRLLEELCRAPGRPLTRAWLLERAWGAAPPAGSRTLDVHVRWLREKVELDPDHPVHLLTVRGVGYQLEPNEQGDDHG